MEAEFWSNLDELIATCPIVIDRPKGSSHPRYEDMIYPVDYGYLSGTKTIDGAGIDVWVGSQEPKLAQGLICSVDLKKRDAEIKVLIGCSESETQQIFSFMKENGLHVLLVKRDSRDYRCHST
jgi:inorganic pyrophosphatase